MLNRSSAVAVLDYFTFDVLRRRRLFKMGMVESIRGGHKCEGRRVELYIIQQFINQYVCTMFQLDNTSLPSGKDF